MKALLKNNLTLLVVLSLITFSTVSFAKQSDASIDKMHKGFLKTEQCLKCHGSYEENAQKTANLGKWNPHNSIHGGYVECTNCHLQNKVEKNYCAYCHEYKPVTK